MKHKLLNYCRFLAFGLTIPSFYSSCQNEPPKIIAPAYYYWKTTLQLTKKEEKLLEGKKIYLRFFDVSWNPQTNRPNPTASLRIIDKPKTDFQYIPVVFITNETLLHSSEDQMGTLASHILQKIQSLSKEFTHSYSEVQLDCDWTNKTKSKYFLLLKDIHKKLHVHNIQLSATIRLHQIKYVERTGVPPVDRGMLMFYNMGNWKNAHTKNSLYDLQIANKYLYRLKDYPLPLDIALPILRWTIMYRNTKFLTFLNNITSDSLLGLPFLKSGNSPNQFKVIKDTFAFGCHFRKKDLLRSESCDYKDLIKGKKILLSNIRNQKLSLALFDFDIHLLNYYSHAQIEKIFSPF